MTLALLGSATRGQGALLRALNRSLAIIEFDPQGVILSANANFCSALGYEAAEIVGRHHSIFVDPAYAQSEEYRLFWAKLKRGEFDSREYKRFGKAGREVWIQASYNPVLDRRGRVKKVVKVAADITAERRRAMEHEGKVRAISRVQATIEFTTDGEILTANDLFLNTMGYTLEEIRGRHHRMFVTPEYAGSEDYKAFWQRLRGGEPIAADFQRVGKNGKNVWIQASYNPIFDDVGRVMKVVKFATDATGRVNAVTALGKGLADLATNDLTGTIEEAFDPLYEKLRTDYNAAIQKLSELVRGIVASTNGIRSGTTEVAQAADDLSRRTEQQAASLEETAAALTQITTTVRRTAEATQQASKAVGQARIDADNSGAVMRDAVTAMSGIEHSAHQISQIIGVIDEIAFQTNLLALNAGVEAARAGDAGRGFAVVASEVRALAQRSAQAAKEIKALIQSSTQEVTRGVALVGETRKSLERIVEQISAVNTVVDEIARAAQEQSTGLSEINTAVTGMDQTTQQNAAMVEESTAASRALADETEQLAQMTGHFRLAETVSANTPSRPRVRPTIRQSARVSGRPARNPSGLKLVASEAENDWKEF